MYIKTGTSTWKNINQFYIKTGSAVWKTINAGYVKVASVGWKLFYSGLQVPSVLIYPRVRNASGQNINNDTVISRIGDTLYRYDGTWTNNPTSYQRRWRWRYSYQSEYQAFSPSQTSTTLNTSGHIDDWDNRYVVIEINAINADGESGWITSTNEAHLVKFPPQVNVSLSGTWVVGTSLTASVLSTDTTNILNDTSPDLLEFEWFYGDVVGYPPAQNNNNSDTLLLGPNDAGHVILVRLKATNSGGVDYDEDDGLGKVVEFAPEPFNTISLTKGRLGAVVSGKRKLDLVWEESNHAIVYEARYEGSNDNSSWTTLQFFGNSLYINTTSNTYYANNYTYYRAAVRARGANYSLTTAAYSDGGSESSVQFRNATGTAPGAPTIGSPITVTGSSATIPYTNSTDYGSGTSNSVEFSLNNSTWYPASWVTDHTFELLSESTAYTFYARTKNSDNLYSSTVTGSFTTTVNAPVNTVAPVLSGDYRSFSVTTGTWTGNPTISYQWQWNTPDTPPWYSLPDGTGSSISISGSTYDGKRIRCVVRATNAGGTTEKFSNQSIISAPPPVITYGPCEVYYYDVTGSCSGTTYVETYTFYYRETVYTDGQPTYSNGIQVFRYGNCNISSFTNYLYGDSRCVGCGSRTRPQVCSSAEIANGCCLFPQTGCGGTGPVNTNVC